MSAEHLHAMSERDLLIEIATQVQTLIGNGQPGRMGRAEAEIDELKRWKASQEGANKMLMVLVGVGTPLLSGVVAAAVTHYLKA